MPPQLGVRISLGSPEADLAAVVWPGVSTIYIPKVESADQIRSVAAHLGRLERLRGIRPGTIEVRPLIESATGVTMAREIASSSARIRAFGVGPNLHISLGVEPDADAEALKYARSECELQARALGLDPQDTRSVLD
ncbi:MAG: aldolase/citrate lyase family protein [Chloroflexota bacterium]|nr:aldolase/citrate lyase family protein [Chloroflexota bacterium]